MWPPRRGGIFSTSTIAILKYAQYAMQCGLLVCKPPRKGGIFSTSTIATPKYAQYAMWPPRRGEYLVQVQQQS